MNESESIVTAEATTAPQDPSEETAAPETHEETPVSEGEGATADTENDDGAGTIPAEADDGGAADAEAQSAEGITYRYNHRTYRATATEAQQLLMRGRRFDTIAPQLDRLHRIAQARGQGLEDLIDEIESSYERQEIERIAEKTGGNQEMARQLYELQKEKARSKYKTLLQTAEEEEQAEREDTTRRMGEQLAELQKEFPEIKGFRDIPKAVVQDVEARDIHLLDSYLRWQHQNAKAAAAERAAQNKAAVSSTGSLQSEAEEKNRMDEQSTAFTAAFRKNFY